MTAEQERRIVAEVERVDAIADEAWREWAQTHALDNSIPPTCFRSGFALGYARGRADAQELPEVRAEELVDGQWYWAWEISEESKPVAVKAAGQNVCVGRFKESKIYYRAFRGPLRVGEGK